jgi:transposase
LKGIGILFKKYLTCPECNKNNVACIFWGYPTDTDLYLQAIKDKEIVGGGCLVSDNDPKWECTDCHHKWGTREEDEDK